MKKLFAILLVLALAVTLAACGTACANHADGNADGKCDACGKQISSGTCQQHKDADGNGKCDNCGEKMSTGADGFPRYTGFDGTDDVARACLQNCHIIYKYDGDCEGDPTTVLTGEFMTCLDRFYCRTFTLYGYDEHIHGNAEYALPDNHRAIIYKDGTAYIYDFYLKIIASDPEHEYRPEDSAWDEGYDITSFSDDVIMRWAVCYNPWEPSSYSGGDERFESIEGKAIAGRDCNGYMEYTSYSNPYLTLNTYDYRVWVDPVTELTLRYEWHVGHYDLDEVGKVFEVTSLELNCVSQSTFDAMIQQIIDDLGGEAKFKHMSIGEYWEIFE